MKQTLKAWVCAAALIASTLNAKAETKPLSLVSDTEPESVYALPTPPRPDEGVNEGGVHLKLQTNYMTDYVYRGLEILEAPGPEDRPNLQFDGKLSFDLGKAPHPFIGVFVNVADSDPISRFQEIRPYFGFDWTIAPFTFSGGNITYIYPDRDPMNTSEAFVNIAMNDSFIFRTEKPILSPYIFGAYDFNKYHGTYVEVGVSHDFPVEDTGITFTLLADIAYVERDKLYNNGSGHTTGPQHYDVGVIFNYSLNTLFNVSHRYGEWSWRAYLYYTDNINDHLRGTTQTWGGTGIGFSY